MDRSNTELVITLSKKGNLQQCQNYQTISLNSHPSKVMLKIILNRLKPQAEKIIAEEQAGFRAGRTTTEQIFNLRILCEKYLQHRQDTKNRDSLVTSYTRVAAKSHQNEELVDNEELTHKNSPQNKEVGREFSAHLKMKYSSENAELV